MPVIFKGGNSGSPGKDYLPSVPSSGHSQPVLNTETSGAEPSTIHLQAEQFSRPHYQQATPDFMPTGGTVTENTTDVCDPTAKGSGSSDGDRDDY